MDGGNRVVRLQITSVEFLRQERNGAVTHISPLLPTHSARNPYLVSVSPALLSDLATYNTRACLR